MFGRTWLLLVAAAALAASSSSSSSSSRIVNSGSREMWAQARYRMQEKEPPSSHRRTVESRLREEGSRYGVWEERVGVRVSGLIGGGVG